MIAEKQYVEEQLGLNSQYCDIGVIRVFNAGMSTVRLKCVVGFNQHGSRNHQINYSLISNECPCCLLKED